MTDTYPLVWLTGLRVHETHHVNPVLDVRVMPFGQRKLASIQVTVYSRGDDGVDKENSGHLLVYSLQIALVEILGHVGWDLGADG